MLRDIRDFVVWTVMWLAVAVAMGAMTVGPLHIAMVPVAGGVAAGVCIAFPMQRWWPLLVSGLVVSYLFYLYFDVPPWLAVVRGVANVAAAATYALIIVRHRRPGTGLGADLRWVLTGLVVAVLFRTAGLGVHVLADRSDAGDFPRAVWLACVIGTLTGYLAGSALVLGIVRWRRVYRSFGKKSEFVGGTVTALAFIAIIMFTPVGTAIPGAVYLVIPILLFAAIRAPEPVAALLTGVAVLSAGIAAAQGLGPFESFDSDEVVQVLTLQVGMFVIATSIFVLSSTESDRRYAQIEADRASLGMRTVFAESPVASAWVALDAGVPVRLRQANPAFLALFGLTAESAKDANLAQLLVDPVTHEHVDVRSGADFRAISGGETRWLRPSLSHSVSQGSQPNDLDDSGPVESAVLALEDVTTARASEELMRQHMRRDSLTGLPNRVMLIDRLDEALGDRTPDTRVGLIILDIDGLKAINDSLGHSIGDHVIVEVGRRVVQELDPSDVIMRIAGDEFCVIIRRPVGGETVDAVAARIVALMRDPVMVGDDSVAVTVSAGAVEATAAHRTPADLLRSADVALIRAENAGRNRAAVFSTGDDQSALERLGVVDRLRYALQQDDLVLHFQPIVLTENGAVTGAEVLVRLHAASGALIPPDRFLPLAAELGLLGALTEQVLDKACSAAERWRAAGTEVRVAFNAPPRWLSVATVERITARIDGHHLPWSTMTLEVTEEATLDLDSDVIDALTSLRTNGMHIAIDDFGTGYAGLDSFRSIPADIVKIDRSFVADLFRSSQDRDFVYSMVELIHRFGKVALAEGVETAQQLEALRRMGCDYAQGFLFSRPVPFADFPAGRMLTPIAPMSV